jgi:hypothetical protein
MLESIEYFVNRLWIYTETPHSMLAVDEVVVTLMVEQISTPTLGTGKLKKRLPESFLANVFSYPA